MQKPEDESSLSAEERIRQFVEDFGKSRNLGGFGEELAQCSRIAQTLVRTDNLTQETLSGVFSRAHENIPTGATYILALRVLEEAAKTGKLTAETLAIVEACVIADKDPVWESVGRSAEHNTRIMQKLMLNPYLFNLMLPYMDDESHVSFSEER